MSVEPSAPAMDLVGKIRLFVERLRALGAVPEYCTLAWDLCNENERLKAEVARLRSVNEHHGELIADLNTELLRRQAEVERLSAAPQSER